MTHRFATRYLFLAVLLALGVWLIPSALRAVGPPPGASDTDCRLEHNPAYNQEDGLAPNDPNNRYDGVVCPLTADQRASTLSVGTTYLRLPGGQEWQFLDNPRRATVSLNAVAIGIPAHLVITANTADAPGGGQATIVDSQLTNSASYAPPIRITEVGRGIEASTVNIAFPPPDGAGTVYLTVERLPADPPPGEFTLSGTTTCVEGSSRVDLAWTPSAGAQYYYVARDGLTVAYVPAPTTTYSESIAGGRRYDYVVQAFNGFGNRSSNTISVRPPTTTECSPVGLVVDVQPPSATVEKDVGSTEFRAEVGFQIPRTRHTINFDQYPDGSTVPVNAEIQDQYRSATGASFGVTAAGTGPVYARSVDFNCPGSEASSQPNFLAGLTNTLQPITISFDHAVEELSFQLISVGANVVTVQFLDGTGRVVSSPSFGGRSDGNPDGVCNKDSVSYTGSVPIQRINLVITEYRRTGDGFGVDDLSFIRPAFIRPHRVGRHTINFDQYSDGSTVPANAEIQDQYRRETGASFGVTAAGTGPVYARSVDFNCPGSEASSQPNFLAGVNGTLQPITIAFDEGVTDLSFQMISLGSNRVSVQFLDAGGGVIATTAMGGIGFPGFYDGLCRRDPVIYTGNEPVHRINIAITEFSQHGAADGFGIDDLTYTIGGSSTTLTWGLRNYTLGSITPLPADPFRAVFGAGSQTGFFPELVEATATYVQAGVTSTAQDWADITITGGAAPEPPTVDLRVNGLDAATITEGESATLSWTSTNAHTCTADANPLRADWTGPRPTNGTQPTSPTQNTTYTLDCFGDGGQATDSVPVTVRTRPRVEGDVLAHGSISNLVIDSRSLIAANAVINTSGGALTLPGYRPVSSTDYRGAAADIWERLDRLRSERGRTLAVSAVSNRTFNLNPPPGVDPIGGDLADDFLRPEGSLWFHEGDLTLDNVTFKGRGTIVVLGGDLTITGTLRYHAAVGRADSLGLMVITNNNAGGNLTVAGSATNWVGAYFVGGTATLAGTTGASSEFVGNLAANTIAINRTNIRIVYDSRVELVPPPGFDRSFFARLRESY